MKTWSEVAFKDILEDGIISYGIVQPGSHTCVNSVPVLRVNNISQNGIDTSNILMVSKSIEGNYARTRLKGGELLITVVGNVGLCVNVPEKLKGWNVARAIAVANINNIFDSNFIKYQFYSDNIKFQIYGHLNDTVQPTLNLSSLKEIKFYVPPLPEQRAIASVLSSLDDKIDLLHRQNVTLEAMAEALFKKWFVVDAKEEWEDGYLPDEFEITMGQSPSGTSFNELGLGIPMFQGNADFGFRFPSKRVYTTDPTRFAEKYDTLISVRAPVGAQNMANERCCIGRGLAAFRYKTNPSFYTYTYFKLRHLLKELTTYNDEGTVFGSISKNDFNNFVTQIPDDDSVNDYEKKCSPINNKITHNCHQIDILEKLRDSLLPKLMSGEVRVKF